MRVIRDAREHYNRAKGRTKAKGRREVPWRCLSHHRPQID